ncbi:MAG: DNA mismatch repair endonuclease MutL, partial [Phycisphaerales bacterium]|nr:DNA mismatch repair endonuclease MutL [Phycisphaerales bacterium]
MPIRRLPTLLVNQIAAGEVIERPANVVKEAVENALDAGATQIDVTIESGGRDLVRVSDDGAGIPRDELLLAIAPHATSKIAEAEDLEAIGTLGFRGEALASIASVSRLTLTSRPADQVEAWTVETEGDRVDEPRPSGAAPGTTVTVRNLFFNTPARRKFLKTDQTESTRCADLVRRLAMAHPAVGFTLVSNGRTVIDLPRDQGMTDRVLDIVGRELEPRMLMLMREDRGLAMWGLVGQPEIARNATKGLWLFLNGRPIMDRSVIHAVKEAYRGLIEPSRYPTVALFIEMDPSLFDVNVHPTKAEVRFRQQSTVHAAVHDAVRDVLRGEDLTPAIDLDRAGADARRASFGDGYSAAPEFGGGRTSTAAFVDYFKRLDPTERGFVYGEVKQAIAAESPELLVDDLPAARDPEV